MKNIEIVLIPVLDQQKAKEFYMKIGFKVVAEAPMGDGENWVQLGITNQTTSIALMRRKEAIKISDDHQGQGIMLLTDDIEKEVQDLKTKGIEAKKIDDTPWGKFTWFSDPDGNEISLHQARN